MVERAFKPMESSMKTEQAIAEIWALFREPDRRMQETDRKVKEVTVSVGRLTNRLGENLSRKWCGPPWCVCSGRGVSSPVGWGSLHHPNLPGSA
jgi:hypothetical protein